VCSTSPHEDLRSWDKDRPLIAVGAQIPHAPGVGQQGSIFRAHLSPEAGPGSRTCVNNVAAWGERSGDPLAVGPDEVRCTSVSFSPGPVSFCEPAAGWPGTVR